MVFFKCPNLPCKSTLFHIEKTDDIYEIKCYKTKECGWSMTLSMLRKCPYCGQEIRDRQFVYCPFCGAELEAS